MTGGGGGGGGVQQRFIFYTQKKSQLQNLSTQKDHYIFCTIPKISLVLFSQPKKNPSVFYFVTQKYPDVFHRSKKITFGRNSRPKKITRTFPPLKYVSGAPGNSTLCCLPPHLLCIFTFPPKEFPTGCDWLHSLSLTESDN